MCVQGGWPGDGNIDADPQWAQADQGEFTLPDGSPCRAAGRPLLQIRDDHDLDRNGDREEVLPIGLPVTTLGQEAVDLGSAPPVPARNATR